MDRELDTVGVDRFCICNFVLDKGYAIICDPISCIHVNGGIRLLLMANSKIIKIAVIGPESTGKSVLSEQLAKYLKTVFVPEFAREYFNNKNIEGHTQEDLEAIYKKQLLLEAEAINRANKFLICDTNLISGKVWADVVFNGAPSFILENLTATDHDLHLLCDIDLPWVADSQRRNEYDRKRIMEMHLNELTRLNATFEVVSGFDNERLQNAIKAIQRHYNI